MPLLFFFCEPPFGVLFSNSTIIFPKTVCLLASTYFSCFLSGQISYITSGRHFDSAFKFVEVLSFSDSHLAPCTTVGVYNIV